MYLYAFGLRDGEPAHGAVHRRPAGRRPGLFVVDRLYLRQRPEPDDQRRGVARTSGGTTAWAAPPPGPALNLADPTLWPRWLLMFGLALGTTAVWAVVDAAWLAARESEEYKRWVRRFAFRSALAGAVWATIAGTWYVFGTWAGEILDDDVRCR